LVGVTGVLSGRGPAGAPPADAAILRGADAALHATGSIVIERWSSVLSYPPSAPDGMQTHSHGSAITETPTGPGPQSEIEPDTGSSAVHGVQNGYVRGHNELYDPIRHVVYDSSNYGPDISPGARPGTYVYTYPAHALFFRLPSEALAPAPPLTITASQARQLLDGSAEVSDAADATHKYRMSVHPAFRVGNVSAEARAQLGRLKVIGTTVVDGRRAIKLVPSRRPAARGVLTGEYDVAPGTYYPIRLVIEDAPGAKTTITWSEYRVLPATPVNERLLSMAARHPGARIDRSRADFIAAWDRLSRGD
ncbi:MAG: hypothetical protein M3Y09_07075, partial [Actinomycetota bacterium]|nr:hypothetical protein [Actinomycetota bacterium]